MPVPIQAPLPSAVAAALGLANRGQGWRGVLLDQVMPVVLIPSEVESAVEGSGFEDAETLAGTAFMKWANQTAVAAQLSHVQLKNPANSFKVCYLDVLFVSLSAAGNVLDFGPCDTDLATLVGTAVNKNNSGVNSLAQVRMTTNVADLRDADMGFWGIETAQVTYRIPLNPPVRLASGEGFAVRSRTVNLALNVAFEFREYNAG